MIAAVRRAPREPLVIGLVNNMPRAAARTTEWQFRALLSAAAVGRRVELHCFLPPETRDERRQPRADEKLAAMPHAISPADGRADVGGALAAVHQEALDAIWGSQLDGLIVTGMEPRATAMADEPSWPMLADLVDWAAERTLSSIWSCMAAHAAAHRLDGLRRQLFPTKMSGVFTCVRAAAHPLLAALPPTWPVPHSRNNTITDADLAASGYDIISTIPDIGADCFVRPAGSSLFVMLQGHPEYDSNCLLREYRRDVRRYLTGRRTLYPAIPCNVFDAAEAAALRELQAAARRDPADALLERLDRILAGGCAPTWQQPAAQLFNGWLSHLAIRKSARRGRAFERLAAAFNMVDA